MSLPECIRIALVAVGCGVSTGSIAGQSPQLATVRLRVVDVFGRKLPYYVDSFVSARTGRDFTSRFSGLDASGLPFDMYRYRLLPSGLHDKTGWLTGQVDATRKDVLTVLLGSAITAFTGGHAATVSIRTPPEFSIEGDISPPPGQISSMWVRLQGLYQDYRLDASVSPEGIFRICEPLQGTFLLTVLKDGTIIDVQPVVFKQGGRSARFGIDLSNVTRQQTVVGPPQEND